MLPFDLKSSTLACLSALTLADHASAAQAATAVPPGFEDIAAGSEERLNVNFLGQSLGLFRVFVTLDAVRFEEPERLVEAIRGELKPETTDDAILAALGRAMARNGNLSCNGQRGVDGCGYVETDSTAVIHDEADGNIELFVTRDWLGSEERHARFREPTAATHNALIHQQTMNLSSGRHYRSLSIAGTGALGLSTRSFIGANWTFAHSSYARSSDTRVRLDDIYYRRDIGSEHYAQAGRMDNRNLASTLGGNFGFTMLPVNTLDGVRFGTTLAYLNPEAASQGTPITLLLPRDARVDAYRGNELLGSFYLRAGVNALDTARFPEGAYPVTLRVFEDGVQVRTQTSPFTKTGGGVSAHTRQWFVQAGRMADRDGPSGATVAGGVRIPLPREITLTSGIATVKGRVYNETSLDWQHAFPAGVLSVGGAIFVGSDGSRGNTQQLSFVDGVSWSFYRYQMRGAGCSSGRAAYRDIGCYDTVNATVSAPIGRWSAALGYTYNKSVGRSQFDDFPDTPSGPWARRPAYRTGDRISRALQASVSRSLTWHRINANLQFGVYANRGGGMREYGGYVGVTLTHAVPAPTAGRASVYTSAGVNVRSDRGDTTTDYTLERNWTWDGGSHRELDLRLSGYGTDSLTGDLQGRWNGRYGDVAASVANSYDRRNGGNNPSVTASYASSFAIARQGVFLGSAASQSDPLAGFAVRVSRRDGASGAAAEISTEANRRIRIGFGQRALVPVSGFTQTTSEVGDAGVQGTDGQTSVVEGIGKRPLFMVPGQLALRSIDAKVTYLYVGQAYSANGLPLADGLVLNGVVPALDDDGGFVAELDRKEKELFIVDGPTLMRCPLHVERRQDIVMMVGKIRCDIAAPDALPERLRKQARVRKLLNHQYVMSTRARTTGVPGEAR